MAKNKERPSSQANMLREQGLDPLTPMTSTKQKFNPIGFYNPNKEKYIQLWTKYDFDQCTSRFVWENLPNGLTSWNLERMLYFYGSLCGFGIGGYFYILPYVNSGKLNAYGIPTKIKPIPFVNNGFETFTKNYELNVDVKGDANDRYSAVILYDSVPYNASTKAPSRYYYNSIIIKEIADTFARVNINVVISNKKILLEVKDTKQKEVIEQELKMAFASDCPFALISSPLETNSIQSTSDFNADELFNTIKNYDAIRCFMSGISSKSFGTEKKERLVSGELTGAEEERSLVLDSALYMRQLFCDQVNAKFGLNIKVRKRAEDYQQEVNGNGLTQQEEEEEL